MKRLLALALVSAAAAQSCSDAFIEPRPEEKTNVDNRLALTGRVCTDPPDPTGFPVKVVLVVDQSGSMCVSDPPGSQEVGGFCQQIASLVVPPGVSEPSRVRAAKRLVAQFAAQNAAGSNISVSLVPFETNVKNPFPTSTGSMTSRFTPAGNPGVIVALDNLQSQLGKGTDYQGALSYAYTVVADDIAITNLNNPEQLPRTRYVVVFLTDGTPYPRCAGNDSLTTYASPDQPELLWADSSGSGDFCNQIDPPGTPPTVIGFVPGTDRNQNYQLFSYVDQLMELRDAYNIGDIRLHTILLFNEDAVRACGAICQDLYGTYPGVPIAQYPQQAKKIATWTLQQMAQRGNGVYQEFVGAQGVASIGLGALDYSSLASKNVMKQLLVKHMSSAPGDVTREVDTDADGLIDSYDQAFKFKTSQFAGDSDGDCFDDDFEVRHYDEGFRPDSRDSRGCPLAMATCACDDTDGDGLSTEVEQYLKTKDTLMDTDGDGIPDGIEVRYGLDPRSRTASGLDTDGDGLPDSLEIRSDSSPIRRDNVFFDKQGYQYETKAEEQPDQSICYDFSVTNLQMVTPPKKAGFKQGHNLFKVFFAQSPESGVATDYGVWRVACAWAQYDPPTVRVPLAPDLAFENRDFRRPPNLNSASEYATGCIGIAP